LWKEQGLWILETLISRKQETLVHYQQTHHTHFHDLGNGRRGSARLDRVYVGIAANKYVRGVSTEEPLCRADHRAVLLELHGPDGPIKMKPRAKIYPPPAFVQAATQSLTTEQLELLRQQVERSTATETIAIWQALKGSITGQMKALKRAARERMTSGFREKIKRLKTKLHRVSKDGADAGRRPQLLEELQHLQDAEKTGAASQNAMERQSHHE